MADSGLLLAALVLGVLVATRAPGTIKSGTTSARWVLAALGLLSLALLSFLPASVRWLAAETSVTHLNQPLGRGFVVLALLSGQTALRVAVDPLLRVSLRGSGGAAVTSIGLMWATFAVTPENAAVEYAARPDLEPGTAVFLLAFLAYVSYAAASILVGAWCHSNVAPPSTRLSLRLIAAGCACCLGYSVAKVVEIGGVVTGAPLPPPVEQLLTHGLAAVGAVLVAAGAGVVSLSQRIRSFDVRMRDYVASRRLYRVWSELTGGLSTLVHEPDVGKWRDALRVRRVHERLYRRLVELRDAWMELRPYFDAAVIAEVNDRRHTEGSRAISPYASAAMLRTAALASRQQIEPTDVWISEPPAHKTMEDELNWWVAVAEQWSEAEPAKGSVVSQRRAVAP